jgi:hypothetical protein
MKDLYAALAIATAITAGAGLTIKHVRGTDYYCPPATAASVETLFAPCQAFDTAVGHKITKQEAVPMGLLTPEEQPTPTRVAEGSAVSEWINPKTVSDNIRLVMRGIL